MIALVEKLIEGGHAYEVEGDVYFAVRSYEGYGQLSGRNVDEMESGHRELRADGQGLEDRSVILSISLCGRPPSQASLRGILLGAKVVPAGISNARLCRRSTWVSRLISTVAAQTWRSPITKPSVLSRKLLWLHVLQLLDAWRHASDQPRKDVQVAGQLLCCYAMSQDHRCPCASHADAANALPKPARFLRRAFRRIGGNVYPPHQFR